MSKLNNIVMFACNEGGHFSQLTALHQLFDEYDSVLVTDNDRANLQTKKLEGLKGIEYAMSISNKRKSNSSKQTNKKKSRLSYLFAHIKMWKECRKIWKTYRPSVIISTGSNIAVHLFLYGKLHGSKLIFIETRAHVYSKSATGMIVGRFADKVFVQWPEMLKVYPRAEYCGTLV